MPYTVSSLNGSSSDDLYGNLSCEDEEVRGKSEMQWHGGLGARHCTKVLKIILTSLPVIHHFWKKCILKNKKFERHLNKCKFVTSSFIIYQPA